VVPINPDDWSYTVHDAASQKTVFLIPATVRMCDLSVDICKAWLQSYGTVQTNDFSLCIWYCPQVALEGCQVSWLQDIAEWISLCAASY
jgi:hypothetical protein